MESRKIRQLQNAQASQMQSQAASDQKAAAQGISIDDIDLLCFQPEMPGKSVNWKRLGVLSDERLYVPTNSMMPPQVIGTFDTINNRIREEVMARTFRNTVCDPCGDCGDGAKIYIDCCPLTTTVLCPFYALCWPICINPPATKQWNQLMKQLANVYIEECNKHNASNSMTLKVMWVQGFRGKSAVQRRAERNQGTLKFHPAVPLTDAEDLPYVEHESAYRGNRNVADYQFYVFLDVSEGSSKAAFKEWLSNTILEDQIKGFWAQQWPMKAKKARQGGSKIAAPAEPEPETATSSTDVSVELANLKKMKDDGTLSDAEFTAAKARALGMS